MSECFFVLTLVQALVIVTLGILDQCFFIHGVKIDYREGLLHCLSLLGEADRLVASVRFTGSSPSVRKDKQAFGNLSDHIPDLARFPPQSNAADAVSLDTGAYVFNLRHY